MTARACRFDYPGVVATPKQIGPQVGQERTSGMVTKTELRFVVTCNVDESGAEIGGGGLEHGRYETLQEAARAIIAAAIDGRRGLGCFSIIDGVSGREWSVGEQCGKYELQRFNGDGALLETSRVAREKKRQELGCVR